MREAQNKPALRRIRKVQIHNFRGFVKPQREHQRDPQRRPLNTDADIVLLAGGNGSGKTSLLQALTLLLTGYAELPQEQLRSVLSVPNDPPNSTSESPIYIEAAVDFSKLEGSEHRDLTVQWPSGEAEPSFAFKSSESGSKVDWPRLLGGAELTQDENTNESSPNDNLKRARELLARVTSFYPERVDELFENLTEGKTLRDIFYPIPEAVRRALRVLDDLSEQIETSLERLRRAQETPEQLEENLRNAQNSLVERWKPIHETLTLTPEYLSELAPAKSVALTKLVSLSQPDLSSLQDLVREFTEGKTIHPTEVASTLLNELIEILEVRMEQAQKDARAVQGAEKLEAEKGRIQLSLDKIQREFPALDAELACFTQEPESTGLVDLLTVFRSIAKQRDIWLANASQLAEGERTKLASVIKELEAVVPNNAHMRRQELEQWLEPRRTAEHKRQELERRLSEINELLKKHRFSDEVKYLRDMRGRIEKSRSKFERAYRELLLAKRREERHDELEAEKTKLEDLQISLKEARSRLETASGASEQILKHTAELATKVLKRFSLVEGILPLQHISPSGGDQRSHIRTDSGLALSQLSLGQKSQVAVSLAVAQSELLRAAKSIDLPFHVLLLDDVSTAYDLSNITREAILWRQLAYNKEPEQRWQLFISSHHEDLTNHLLDLLVPPHGASLRLLRFKEWSNETGPLIESFWVEPSRELDETTRRHIRENVQELLCPAS